jgi:hypothetical protein
MPFRRMPIGLVVGLLAVAACTDDDGAAARAAAEATATLRQQLAAAKDTARAAVEGNRALMDSISKLQLRIEQIEADAIRENTPPPSVAGTWSDGRRTLRISDNGTYSLMDLTGAFEGYWQLNRDSRQLDLSPPLGSKLSGRVSEDWRSIAVEFQVGSRNPSNWVLSRQN